VVGQRADLLPVLFGGGVVNTEDLSFSRAIGSVIGDVSAKVGGSAVGTVIGGSIGVLLELSAVDKLLVLSLMVPMVFSLEVSLVSSFVM
jgi:hypothetical protein